MRTLTHNLTLAPPLGIVDMAWQQESRAFEGNRSPLNLLLLPFPFKISAKCFKPDDAAKRQDLDHDHWSCTFRLHQRWLMQNGAKPVPEPSTSAAYREAHERVRSSSRLHIVEFVSSLIKQARSDVKRIHGLILPELALDWETYRQIVARILVDAVRSERDMERRLDFIVCGSSSDCSGNTGNHVLVTTFALDKAVGRLVATTHCRPKHHRWRLTGSQIADYGLSASLDPQIDWWEEAEITQRQVGLTVFRRNSVFSAMICEDLARSEPCHEPLKNIGPNLVFTLLMDGSQLPSRWPARYATSLADDPGSAVLTLTSLGLIERTNAQGRYSPPTRNVALWKESGGRMEQIPCPSGTHGILLTLGGEVSRERTFDGRMNDDTTRWRYQGHQPVSLPRTQEFQEKFAWIVDGVPFNDGNRPGARGVGSKRGALIRIRRTPVATPTRVKVRPD
jgi:hypothetical protein